MLIRQLFDQQSYAFTYLLIDEPTRQAALIDPVREQLERDLTLIRELSADLRYVLETHVHADHVTSAAALAVRTGAVTCASELGASCATRHLRDGDTLVLGYTSRRDADRTTLVWPAVVTAVPSCVAEPVPGAGR